MTNNRPGNLSTMFLTLAEWMDLADQMAEVLAAQRGEALERETAVQDDLRSLASWFYEHSEVDEEIYQEVFGDTVAP